MRSAPGSSTACCTAATGAPLDIWRRSWARSRSSHAERRITALRARSSTSASPALSASQSASRLGLNCTSFTHIQAYPAGRRIDPMANDYLFTSESVSEGHPDKVADQISDAVLDAILREDPRGRVACETLVKTGVVILAGEVTTSGWVDVEALVRKTVLDIGYNSS